MYSIALRTADAALHDLDRILTAPQVFWYAPAGAPPTWSRAFAMRLRNAMHAAHYNASHHAHLARYAELFDTTVVKVVDTRTVVAIAAGRSAVEAETATSEDEHTAPAPVIATPYERTLAAFYAKKHTNAYVRIAFCELTSTELGELAFELGKHQWMVMLAFDGALTLAPDDPLVPPDAKVAPMEVP